MDETHQSRVSDAAATRKRRSSILKSQRPPRTPFSELEFNVATPTDTTKSRRVSFSRRTGVAEFVTNEATTTWKNFYEEHNKSLELSGNESGANAARHPVGHIGQTMFDRQFQEVEAVDFITSLDNLACRNVNASLNNFTNQLASIDGTCDDIKLAAPQNNFELSALTEQQTKFFGDDLTIPIMGEISGRINLNFSTMQNIGDDLDEIKRDLQNVQSNIVGPQHFRNNKGLSEYIEVELNSTHIDFRNEESDMSITETIQSPKVQDISKINITSDKWAHLINDLDDDKENKCIPHMEAKLEDFYEMDDSNADISVTSAISSKVTENPEHVPEKTENRQTIYFDDEMENLSMSKSVPAKFLPIQSEIMKSNMYESSLLGQSNLNADSMKKAEESTTARRRTKVYERDDIDADMSVTAAMPQNIYENSKKSETRNTILFGFENADMSITMAVPEKNVQDATKQIKRQTIVFDDEMGDISMTKPISAKLLSDHKEILRKSTSKDINLTSDNKQSKRHTIVFDDEMADISMTKPIPAQLLFDLKEASCKSTAEDINLTCNNKQDKIHTMVFDGEMADISMTKPISAKLLSDHKEILRKSTSKDLNLTSDNKQSKRHTIVFDDEMADISMTKPIPAQLLFDLKEASSKSTIENINLTSNNKQDKRQTMVFDDDMADLSMTKPISPKLLSVHEILRKSTNEDINLISNNKQSKRQTIVFDDETADISMTKPIPAKLLSNYEVLNKSTNELNIPSNNKQGEKHTIVFDDEMVDLSAKSISSLLLPEHEEKLSKSITANVNLTSQNVDSKRHTIVFENEKADISVTNPILPKLLSVHKEILSKSAAEHTILTCEDKESVHEINVSSGNQSAFAVQVTNTQESHKLTDNIETTTNPIIKNVEMEMSLTNVINIPKVEVKLRNDTPANESSMSTGLESKTFTDTNAEQKLILDFQDKNADISVKVTTQEENKENLTLLEKRYTIVLDDKIDNLTITKPIPAKLLSIENEILSKTSSRELNLISHNEDYNSTVDINNKSAKRHTIAFDDEMANISITKPIPAKLLSNYEVLNKSTNEYKTSNNKQDEKHMIVFDEEMVDLSAKPISPPLLSVHEEKSISANVNLTSLYIHNNTQESHKLTDKIDTTTNLTIKNVEMEMSLTNVNNIPKVEDKLRNDTPANESSMSTGLESKTITDTNTGQKLILDRQDKNADMSVKVTTQEENKENLTLLEKRNTIVFDDKIDNIAITKPIPAKLLSIDNEMLSKSTADLIHDIKSDLLMTKEIPTKLVSVASQIEELCDKDIIAVTYAENKNENIVYSELKRKSIATNTKPDISTNISIREVLYRKSIVDGSGKRKTITFEDEVDLSVNKSIMSKQSPIKNKDVSQNVSIHANKNIVVCKVFTDENSDVKIPPYLKNVSEEIKSLMNDLVKPMADVMPFTSTLDDDLKKPLTCNTEIQANLTTSSQTDLLNQLDEKSNTVFDENRSLVSFKNEVGCETDNVQNEISSLDCPSDKSKVGVYNLKEISFRPQRAVPEKTVPGGDLIFDYDNPLNNVLLVPLHNTEVHKYNPKSSSDTLCGSDHSVSVQCAIENTEAQNVSVHLGINNEKTHVNNVIPNTQSLLSDISISRSVDQSIDAKVVEVKDSEVNTLIVMKENSELLRGSSSLTLVDDALAGDRFEVEIDTQTTNSQVGVSESEITSPVKVINNTASEEITNQNDFDMSSNKEMNAPQNTSKSIKRNYSPTKREQCKNSSESNLEVTPKPNSKVQRLSNNPKTFKNMAGVHFDVEDNISNNEVKEMDLDRVISGKDQNKSPQKSKVSKKPGTSITVQQLMTEYNIDHNIDQKMLNQKILEALNKSDANSQSDGSGIQSPDLMSFTSSKNLMDAKESESGGLESNSAVSSALRTEIDSPTSRLSESESSLNVVAKIDMLPFMGSHECEWECSGLDSWCFRLLHARLRLLVRLQHRHVNAARTRVQADTPVRAVTVDRVLRTEDTNPVAGVCISFAAEAVQRLSASCVLAGDVPELLRSAAAAGRLARRWGNAMHRARMHLAYKFTDKGHGIKLNVANIPLRCVWEVRMRLEMAYEPKDSVPWPRACDVQAKSVLTDDVVPDSEIQRVLARVQPGWDHVPSTVWQIFKYLKNKTRDDRFLGI